MSKATSKGLLAYAFSAQLFTFEISCFHFSFNNIFICSHVVRCSSEDRLFSFTTSTCRGSDFLLKTNSKVDAQTLLDLVQHWSAAMHTNSNSRKNSTVVRSSSSHILRNCSAPQYNGVENTTINASLPVTGDANKVLKKSVASCSDTIGGCATFDLLSSGSVEDDPFESADNLDEDEEFSSHTPRTQSIGEWFKRRIKKTSPKQSAQSADVLDTHQPLSRQRSRSVGSRPVSNQKKAQADKKPSMLDLLWKTWRR